MASQRIFSNSDGKAATPWDCWQTAAERSGGTVIAVLGNRDRLNDEHDSRFHPYSICLRRDLPRPRVSVGGMIARLSQ